MDWDDWFKKYESSPSLRARLKIVREQIVAALNECPPGPITIVSMCAGDGRDLLGALLEHPRRGDVSATLLDNHLESITRGQCAAAEAGLERQLRFIHADATLAKNYAGIGHADLVVISGFLGHLRHNDATGLIASLPMFCKTGGSVVWNRHLVLHEGSEQVPRLRECFQQTGFKQAQFEITAEDGFAVGRVRFAGQTVPLDPARKLFEFVGLDRFLTSENDRERDVQAVPSPAPPSREKEVEANALMPPADTAGQTLVSRFEQLAVRYEDRTALGADERQFTYGQLNAAANSLAHHLISHGLIAGDRVVILMRHDAPLIVAVLAILKAGGIVVVLNSTDPPIRLQQILDDAEPRLIVTDSSSRELALQIARQTLNVVCFGENGPTPGDNLNLKIVPDDLAFLVYTSGSTGRPKGVMQTHRNILHNVARLSLPMKLQAIDRGVLLASLSGAQGVATTWCILLNGGALYPFPVTERGLVVLRNWLKEHRITVWVSSASLFRHLMKTTADTEIFPDMRLVRLGSEPAMSHDFAAFQRHFSNECALFHTLSSSEAGNITNNYLMRNDKVAEGRLSAGKLSDGIDILLLNEQGRPVADGETGEIAIRSRYLSPGYWRNDALTAERFSDATGMPGIRIFRSGDLGRRLANGQILFMGRKDAQVKIRGYRIEVSEIEDVLAQSPEVEKAVVCARTTPTGDAQLIAYVVFQSGQSCTADTLRQALQSALPSYMTPAGFVFLDMFPLTPHGKIDRAALAKIDPPLSTAASQENFGTETEAQLAQIWRQVFGRESIGRRENFFDLGGDSLSAAVLGSLVQARFGTELDFRALAGHPVLADLAAIIDERRQHKQLAEEPPIVRVPRDGPLPLSFEEERIWQRWCNRGGIADGRTGAKCFRVSGPLNIGVLHECMNYLVQRHEMLRTTFDEISAKPVRIIHPARPILLRQIDLTGVAGAEKQTMRLLREDARCPFDLRQGPLIRMTLVRIRDDEHHLLVVSHHIILDLESWDVYFRELAALYEAKLRGDPPPLPDSEPIQYADFAAWQRTTFNPARPGFQKKIQWWRNQVTFQSGESNRRNGWKRLFSRKPRPTDLPLKRFLPLPRRIKRDEGFIFWGIDPQISRRLDHISREERATVFMTRLAVVSALIAHEAKCPNVMLGTFVTNRTRFELQNIFGDFAETGVLCLSCDAAWTFRQWLARVRDCVSEVRAHSGIPFRILSQELRKTGVELEKHRIVFSVTERNLPERFGGLEMTRVGLVRERGFSSFNITFDRRHEDKESFVAFNAGIYAPAKVHAFVERLKRLLEAVSLDPDATLAELITQTKS